MNTENLPDTAEHRIGPTAQVAPPEPLSARVRVEFGSASHTGLVRRTNEDSFMVGRVERSLQTLASNLPPGYGPDRFDEVSYGMLVADGLGGMKGGEVASRLAVVTFVNLVLHTPDWIMRVGNDEADRVMDRIAERYQKIGAALAERATEDAALSQMATTLTLACSSGDELFVGHVGDSRAYLLRDGTLIRLTRDHTYAQELADAGKIPQRDVERHRLRHVLTRALGSRGGDVEVEVTRIGLVDGDQLLLCTDGLTGMLTESTIAALIAGRPVQEACDTLIEAALAGGGGDNVTVVLAGYHFPTTF
jgi:serine/threonine protein phosphatase PrpC